MIMHHVRSGRFPGSWSRWTPSTTWRGSSEREMSTCAPSSPCHRQTNSTVDLANLIPIHLLMYVDFGISCCPCDTVDFFFFFKLLQGGHICTVHACIRCHSTRHRCFVETYCCFLASVYAHAHHTCTQIDILAYIRHMHTAQTTYTARALDKTSQLRVSLLLMYFHVTRLMHVLTRSRHMQEKKNAICKVVCCAWSMYACMYVYMYVFLCKDKHTHKHECNIAFCFIFTFTLTYTCRLTAEIEKFSLVCMYVYMILYIYIYIYIYTHTHIHIYINTHALSLSLSHSLDHELMHTCNINRCNMLTLTYTYIYTHTHSHIYTYTCTHAYMLYHHACLDLHIHTYTHTHTHTCAHAYMPYHYACLDLHIHTHTHTYTHKYACIHAILSCLPWHIHTHTYTCMHAYMPYHHAYPDLHIHTYIHTYSQLK